MGGGEVGASNKITATGTTAAATSNTIKPVSSQRIAVRFIAAAIVVRTSRSRQCGLDPRGAHLIAATLSTSGVLNGDVGARSSGTNRRTKPMHQRTVDFIIVGAGSAGAALANRLTENGRFHVLLLEAGGKTHRLSQVPISFARFINRPGVNWLYSSEP